MEYLVKTRIKPGRPLSKGAARLCSPALTRCVVDLLAEGSQLVLCRF
jgi:hypothetical protein